MNVLEEKFQYVSIYNYVKQSAVSIVYIIEVTTTLISSQLCGPVMVLVLSLILKRC